ncbi:hypothetical protein PR202_gb07671 [Eleusine coracana subsp. coracana]|uniref:Gnk2-homologous domain-containing protein n=1 Tax=Eleusine coracana subsp. coracana TaxID=191504 RepID=A0AAV5EAA8_ELECO|nr:hypothetical protein PR202_gb07671 [Eleusine coracana subsp. coracana]
MVMLLFILFMSPRSATAIGHVCGKEDNYTDNSTYQSNLASLAVTLPSNTNSSAQLFATATAGQPPNAVYALALCRGDITINLTACSACVANAFNYSQQACPFARSAAVYDDDCLLRFSGADFLAGPPNVTENATLFEFGNDATIRGEARLVGADVRDMLTQTAQFAAADEQRRFAAAFMDATATTLYSMGQCTPDLSADDCRECLRRIIAGTVNATTSTRLGGRVLVTRCNFRFEANRFFSDDQSMQRITPSSAISPATPVPALATNKRHRTKPWAIALFVASSALAVLTLCFIFYCRWRRRRDEKGKGRSRRKKRTNLLRGDEQEWEMEAELSDFSIFGFNQILEATSNFSEQNKLGEGGFGPVYKGKFPEGIEIAVKRLASHSGQGFIEFKNEENAFDRPTMLDVVAMLSNKTMPLVEPKQPAYFNLRVGNEEESTGTQSCSINDMTVSATAAR